MFISEGFLKNLLSVSESPVIGMGIQIFIFSLPTPHSILSKPCSFLAELDPERPGVLTRVWGQAHHRKCFST